MPQATSLGDAKRRISASLLDQAGISGVGLRGKEVVIYLESDDPDLRLRAERAARQAAPKTALRFEVTGSFHARS